MSDFDRSKPGGLDCICGGTGIVCALKFEDGKTVPDPETIAICDCILDRIERVEELEQALRDVRFHTGLGEAKDGTIAEIRETVDRALPAPPEGQS